MSTLPKPRLTPEEYLAIEEAALDRSEYYQGQMFTMEAATWEHGGIASNASYHIGNQVDRRQCAVLGSNMRIHVPQTGLFTYADVVVICGERKFLDRERMNLLNPTVIVEVVSPSTE